MYDDRYVLVNNGGDAYIYIYILVLARSIDRLIDRSIEYIHKNEATAKKRDRSVHKNVGLSFVVPLFYYTYRKQAFCELESRHPIFAVRTESL